jgi:hypothetical protein
MKPYDLKRERRLAWKKHKHELDRKEVRKADHKRSLGLRDEVKGWRRHEIESLNKFEEKMVTKEVVKEEL